MTLNEMICDNGIIVQGHVIVKRYVPADDSFKVLFDGDAENLGLREDDIENWMNLDIEFIYPERYACDTINIELVQYD